MMKRLSMLLLLCGMALLASAAWSYDLPVTNGSFEDYTMREGWATTTEYPFPDWYTGWAPYEQSVAIPNAYDGERVLQVTTTEGYQYAWGHYGDGAMTYQVQPNSIYTLTVRVMKAPGVGNVGGYIRLMTVPVKGVFADTTQTIETDVPVQTQDGVWTEYTAVLDSSVHTHTIGNYFLISLFGWGGAGHGQYGGGDPSVLYFDGATLDVVPEPGGLLALGSAALGLAGFALRRRR